MSGEAEDDRPAVDASWLAGPVSHAVLAAVDGRFIDVVDIVEHIGARGGTAAMYSACCAWAESVGRMSRVRKSATDTTPVQVTIDPNVTLDLDDAKTRATLFAHRFVVAVLNRDDDMAAALFAAPFEADDPEGAAAGVIALLGLVGQAGRERLAERKAKMSRQRPPRQGRGQ